VVVAVVLDVVAIVVTYAPLTGPDWLRAVPLVAAIGATALLVVGEYRHAIGRPEVVIGDPEALAGQKVARLYRRRDFDSHQVVEDWLPFDVDPLYRLRIKNHGARADVTVHLEITPEPSRAGGSRPLHWYRERPGADGKIGEERTLRKGQEDYIEVVSMRAHPWTENPQAPQPPAGQHIGSFIHTVRSPDGLEDVDLDGTYSLVVRADAGEDSTSRRFRLTADHATGGSR
jgi:hypothetical protein